LKDAGAQVFYGVGPQTPVFVNVARDTGKLNWDGLPPANHVFVNLTGIARRVIGSPFVSAAAAAVAARCIPAIALTALDEAVRTELAEFGLAIELVHKNLTAAREAYTCTPSVDLAPNILPPASESQIAFEDLPYPVSSRFAAPTIRHRGSAALRSTGNWRIERPVIDLGKCKRCFLCYLYCPEAAMILDAENFPHVDYEHCKGCLICYEECPTDAITRAIEV
jgi:pyruvate ferredoxin oxidoreductase gamma subunit